MRSSNLLPQIEVMRIKRVVEIEHPSFNVFETGLAETLYVDAVFAQTSLPRFGAERCIIPGAALSRPRATPLPAPDL